MKVLGIDPGTTRIGYGVVIKDGGQYHAGVYGCLEFGSVPVGERLAALGQEMATLLEAEKPDVVALEKVFFSKNKKTAMEVSEARGVIRFICAQAGVVVQEYAPNEVKQAVSTYGAASKKEVQKMVTLLLKLDSIPTPDDTADALAIALCAGARGWHQGV